MTSSPERRTRVRRTAENRRAEIVAAAARIALADGLERVTLRSIAVDLGVTGGLISHYFPSVDALLAEVFGLLAGAECDEAFAEVALVDSPVRALGALLGRLVDAQRDDLGSLWIEAWHAAPRRPALNDEVARQTERWIRRVTDLVRTGCESGAFSSKDPRATAVRLMAVLDGLSVQVTLRGTIDYASVQQLVFVIAQSELGLPEGTFE